MADPIQNRWAFLVGVDQYWKPQAYPRLNYCVKDVQALEQLLGQVGYEVVCLHDGLDKRDPRFPDLRNVREEFRKLAKAVGPNDLLLVYFACHGTRALDGEPRLILEDANPQDLARTALSLEELEREMRGAGTERLVMMLDACHIGTGTAQRDVSDPEFVRNVYELATGFELLAASTDEQAAYELGGINHGLFSYCVLQALRGAARQEGLEVVTVGSLKAYVLNEMKKKGVKAGIEQDPQRRADGGLGDMILVDYREQALPTLTEGTGANRDGPTVDRGSASDSGSGFSPLKPVSEIERQVLNKRIKMLSQQYLAANEQHDQCLDETQKIILASKITKLKGEIEVIEDQLK